jgi:hypothetical protein
MNLTNWTKTGPPDAPPLEFKGRIYGHPTLKDGSEITIPVMGWCFMTESFITADGGEIRLKDASIEYLSKYNYALKKVIKAAEQTRFMMPYAFAQDFYARRRRND